MAKNKIEESQQSSQGVNLGTQGNQGGSTTAGMKGSHAGKNETDDKHIPNQEKSSARNQKQREQEGDQ